MNFMHLIVPLSILAFIGYVLWRPRDDGSGIALVILLVLAGTAIRF